MPNNFMRIFAKYDGRREASGWIEYRGIHAGFNTRDNFDRWGKLVFDLSAIPEGADIKKAILKLYMRGYDGSYGSWEGTHQFRLRQCSDESFSESTGTLTDISIVEKECKAQWFDFDVTEQVISEMSKDKRIAFVIDSPQTGVKGCAVFYDAHNMVRFPHIYVEYDGPRYVQKSLLGYEVTGWRGLPITWIKNGVTSFGLFNSISGESLLTTGSISSGKIGGITSNWTICYDLQETPSKSGMRSIKRNRYINGYVKDSLVYWTHVEPDDGLIFEVYYILPMKEEIQHSFVAVVHIKNNSSSTKNFNWGFYSGEYHSDGRFPDGSTEEYDSSTGTLKIKHPEGKTWIVKTSEKPSSIYINDMWVTYDYSGDISGQFWYKFDVSLEAGEERLIMIINAYGESEEEAQEILSNFDNYSSSSFLDEMIGWWRKWLKDTFIVETDYPEIDELVNICRCYCKGQQIKDYYGFAAGSPYYGASWPSDNSPVIHMAIAYGHTDMTIPYLTIKIPRNIDYAKEHYGTFVWKPLHITGLYDWSCGSGYVGLEAPCYVNEVAEQLKRLKEEDRIPFLSKVWNYVYEIMSIIDGSLISKEDSEEMYGAFDWCNVICPAELYEGEYDTLCATGSNTGKFGKPQTFSGLCLYFSKVYRNASYLASYMGYHKLAEDWWNKHLRMLELLPKFKNELGIYWDMWDKQYGFHEDKYPPEYNPFLVLWFIWFPHLRTEYHLPDEVLEVNKLSLEKYMENVVDMENEAWLVGVWSPKGVNWFENKIYNMEGVSITGGDIVAYKGIIAMIYAGLFNYVRYALDVMYRKQYGTSALMCFEESGCHYHGLTEFGCTNWDMIRSKGGLAFMWAPYVLEHGGKYSLLFHPFWGRCKVTFGDGTEVAVKKYGDDSKFLQSVKLNGVEQYAFDYKWKKFWVTVNKCSLNNVEVTFGDEPPSKPTFVPDDFTVVLENTWNEQLKIFKVKLGVPSGIYQIVKFRLPYATEEPYLAITGGEIVSSTWNEEDKTLEVTFKASSEVTIEVYPNYNMYYFYSGMMINDFISLLSITLISGMLNILVRELFGRAKAR